MELFYKRCGAREKLLRGADNNQLVQSFTTNTFVALNFFSFLTSVKYPPGPSGPSLRSVGFSGSSERADLCWVAPVTRMMLQIETDVAHLCAHN